ncbi:hypothetical protein Slin15195_G104240 [Septoria linicola]|uniref:Uncharacterized protein n=1 Tax=Septoria linicola TaxID=215465 RepID=A0A9Q9ENI8_9PEZI|nr:hypothetical protein Slin14017_G067280 [Septoria linicola]USW57105.1 hypothetical protein Slin15195_G104240 [Septoria linicola]
MASKLESLPTELLDLILEAIDDQASIVIITRYDERVRVFSSLSRTCRLLHKSAAPYLYRSFESLANGHGIRAFATTLCQRPDLAKLVQVVNLIPSRAKISSPPSPEEARLFIRVLRSLKLDQVYDDIVEALLAGCHTAEMVVIMCLTTSMKILQISNYDHQTKPKDKRVCKHCPDMADCLQAIFTPSRLQSLSTGEDETGAYSQLFNCFLFGKYIDPETGQNRGAAHASISSLLQVPSMRALTCTGLSSDSESMLASIPDGSSNITNLQFVYGNIDSMSILHTLRACRHLADLEISWEAQMSGGEDDEDHDLYLYVSVHMLKKALDLHKDSLKVLSLTDRLDNGIAWDDQPAIGSFHDFSRLRELKIDDQLLLGGSRSEAPLWSEFKADEVFPTSLKFLIIHCRSGILLLEEALRSLGKFHGPNLEGIEVNFPWHESIVAGQQANWVDGTLEQPKSEKITEWSFDFENYEEGRRLTFSCWGKEGRPESIPAALEACVRVMDVGGVEGLMKMQYPEESRWNLAEDVDRLRITEENA